MKTEDLKNALTQARDILQANKDAVSPAMIAAISQLADKLNATVTLLEPVLGLTPDQVKQLQVSLAKLIEVETKLICTDATNNFLHICNTLIGRPLELKAIALFL